ncbi:hypothetical protein [Filimonas effusa]|uniref:Uncharacterized protein n=1 Tax=Filimonas effusa TaxID=2508721 RepID=A0A4Q1D0A5_9BACT|nr:hypothetical protein [Filimonas effusa]RXK81164.1 hypothetical protein ESB13_19680 [Filimonas effusa]
MNFVYLMILHGEQHGKGRVMSEKRLLPREGELEMIDRIAAIVAQKLLSQQDEQKAQLYLEQAQRNYSSNIPTTLAAANKAERIINSAQYQEREGLKKRIMKIARSLGFTAEYANTCDDVMGIDVTLERFGLCIACFIFNCGSLSCDSTVIEKCIHSNFDHILICTPGKVSIELLHEKLGGLISKVAIIAIDGLPELLRNISLPNFRTEMDFKGRKVLVEYNRISKDESDLKSNTIMRVLSNSIMKKGA